MESSLLTNNKRFIHSGTDLILGSGTRHVRVLQLPRICFPCKILAAWNGCFGSPDDMLLCDTRSMDIEME
jgi:hypothetical protein